MEAERKRYTPNDVGPSPVEWPAPRLSEISTLITNGFVGTATPFYTDSTGVPYLYGTNVRANKLDVEDIRYVTREFHEEQSKTALKKGDLLTVQSGHIGETAVVTPEFDGANCHALIVTRLKKGKAYPEYLGYYLNSEIGRARMKGLEVGSTILHINTKDLKKFRVLLPSITEQKKITQILSAWDRAIATTEQLLANSQQQKKALMQQLLTGKKRLGIPAGSYGFKRTRYGEIPEDWSYPAISEVCSQITEKNNDAIDYPVLSCSKYDGFVDSLKYFKKKVYSDDISGYRLIHKGCFGFPSNHVEEGSIGLQNLYDTGIVSPIYIVFRASTKKVNNEYLYAVLKTDHYRQVFCAATNASVDRRGSLRWKEFSAIRVPLPPLHEQQEIASVLSSADQEVGILQARLDLLKQEKKALMQQLLTGKRRVHVSRED